MNNLNTVMMEGTLTRDPQRDDRTPEFSMCKLAIANNRYFYGKEKKWTKDSSYFYVYVFGPVAEACLKYLRKGRGIRVVGRLKQQSWKGNDGFWRERVFIIAEHIEFQPEKKTDDTPPVEPEKKNGPQDTKADTSTIEAQEEARLQAEEQQKAMLQAQSEFHEADSSPEDAAPHEEEPVTATVLDNGIDDEQTEEESEKPIPDEDNPF